MFKPKPNSGKALTNSELAQILHAVAKACS